jgi:hypothetical protein
MFWELGYADYKGACGDGAYPVISAMRNHLNPDGASEAEEPVTEPNPEDETEPEENEEQPEQDSQQPSELGKQGTCIRKRNNFIF